MPAPQVPAANSCREHDRAPALPDLPDAPEQVDVPHLQAYIAGLSRWIAEASGVTRVLRIQREYTAACLDGRAAGATH